MDILSKINTLPNEIQNLIFYYCIQTEADLIRNIDWVKEYKDTFFKMNISKTKKYNTIFNNNIFGELVKQYRGNKKIITYDKYKRCIDTETLSFKNLGFYWSADLNILVKHCIANNIKKFNKKDRISMIKKLMKI